MCLNLRAKCLLLRCLLDFLLKPISGSNVAITQAQGKLFGTCPPPSNPWAPIPQPTHSSPQPPPCASSRSCSFLLLLLHSVLRLLHFVVNVFEVFTESCHSHGAGLLEHKRQHWGFNGETKLLRPLAVVGGRWGWWWWWGWPLRLIKFPRVPRHKHYVLIFMKLVKYLDKSPEPRSASQLCHSSQPFSLQEVPTSSRGAQPNTHR